MKRETNTFLSRTAMTLLVMMMTTATAWAATKTVTYTISYNKETKYWLNGSDNTHYNIGSSIGMAKSYTMPMGDVTITITSAGAHCVISYYARNESINGFSNNNYTFTFASSNYYITNVKIKDLVMRTELSVDNDTKNCTVDWNHRQYKDAQQIEVTLSDTKPLFYYVITYELNGGTNATGNPLSYEKSAGVASFAAATRTGYTFGGWYDNDGLTGTAVTGIAEGSTGDKTLWAKWTANTYDIIFNANGGTGTMSNQTLTYNDAAQALTANAFAREGHDFNGWNTAANGSGTAYANGASVSNLATEQGASVNLYAQWTVLDYQVSFDANGHGTAPATQTVTYGTKATEPTALTDPDGNYIFGGWYRESTCENRWEFGADNVTGATTLYAKWDQDVFTITYVLDGGVNSASNPLIYKKSSGETITLAAPTKTGYTFTGWTPDNGVISSGSTGDKTFTANWQVNQYTITFDLDGGTIISGSVDASITQDYGTTVAAPTATLAKQGHLFNGWANLPATMPGENITVRPDWTELYHHNQVDPTCMNEGTIEYYFGNGEFWTENSDGLTYTTISQYNLDIPATGHTWGTTPQWEWGFNYTGEREAIIKLVCTRCGYRGHTTSNNGDITSEVTTAPTETTDGVMTYTAKITAYGTEYTDTHQEAIPRLFKVAKIGSTEYSYLKDAIEHAASGDVITLYGDVLEPNTLCTVPEYNSVVLDLNGHSVLIDEIITMGSLTVKNGSLVCNINNGNSGNKTLTLDNANLTCVGVYDSETDIWSNGIQWITDNITVTNGSMMYIYGETCLGYGDDDFTLTIDGTSCVVLENAILSNSYGHTSRIVSQFAQYRPNGYTISDGGKVMYGSSEYTDPVTFGPSDISLADNADRSDIIAAYAGYEKNVTLTGRTLYKDNEWNTLCLPFDVTVGSGQMSGATAMTMNASTSGFNASTGELTLSFDNVTSGSTIAAGTPFIVKWTGSDIVNPVFTGVTLSGTAAGSVASTDGKVQFIGTYGPVGLPKDDQSNIFLGAKNTLYWPDVDDYYVNVCRAYFHVDLGGSSVQAYRLNFGDATGISPEASPQPSPEGKGDWFDLSGRKLDGIPTAKGIYIKNGKKIVIK